MNLIVHLEAVNGSVAAVGVLVRYVRVDCALCHDDFSSSGTFCTTVLWRTRRVAGPARAGSRTRRATVRSPGQSWRWRAVGRSPQAPRRGSSAPAAAARASLAG